MKDFGAYLRFLIRCMVRPAFELDKFCLSPSHCDLLGEMVTLTLKYGFHANLAIVLFENFFRFEKKENDGRCGCYKRFYL